jgi:GxxExxY protein
MTENQISKYIVDAAIEVHRTLGGPGLIESVYEEALAWELTNAGLLVERQLLVPIVYKGRTLADPLRLDLLVEKKVIVEAKATMNYNAIFEVQART